VNPIQQTITKQIFKADQPGDRRQVSNFTRLVEKEKNCQIIVNFFLIFARLDLFHFLKRIFLSIFLLKILLSSFVKPIVSAKEEEEEEKQ
jgi:hypothetical protein